MDAIRLLFALAFVGWVMWWVISPPSRAVGRGRALIVAAVCLIVSCIGGIK